MLPRPRNSHSCSAPNLRNGIAPLLAAVFTLSATATDYPRVIRTFMPDAGPSAFAVQLSPTLALCYDPLRGGVNQLWHGTIDLAPTYQAKINHPAKISGEIFYHETNLHPLRLGTPDAPPQHRFKGYRYADQAATFAFTLSGHPVSETLRPTPDGSGLVREFVLPKEGGPAFFNAEAQEKAQVTITGGQEIRPGQWRFEPGARVTMVIQPKSRTANE